MNLIVSQNLRFSLSKLVRIQSSLDDSTFNYSIYDLQFRNTNNRFLLLTINSERNTHQITVCLSQGRRCSLLENPCRDPFRSKMCGNKSAFCFNSSIFYVINSLSFDSYLKNDRGEQTCLPCTDLSIFIE